MRDSTFSRRRFLATLGAAAAPTWPVGSRLLRSVRPGSAWITGFASYVVDPEDPYPDGFTVGDIW